MYAKQYAKNDADQTHPNFKLAVLKGKYCS